MRKAIIGMTITLAAAGCSQTPIQHGEEFAADGQVSQVTKIADAQANRGARVDATLYPFHFDGKYLNALGMAKLDRMLKDQADPPVEVWMNLPEDEKYESRRMSVAAYLKDKGLPSDEVVFGKGGNPATDHPAAQGLKDLPKADQDSSGSGTSSSPTIGTSAVGGAAATPGQ